MSLAIDRSLLGRPADETLAACPICEADRSVVVSREGVLYNRLEERTRLVSRLCVGCGVVYTNPRLSREVLEEFYEREQARRRRESPETLDAISRARGLPRVEFLLPHLSPAARVLEIGSGSAAVAACLAERLPAGEVTALDPSYACEVRPRANLRLVPDRLDDRHQPHTLESPYDCVMAFHVLEHQHAPVMFLEAVRRLTTPDGLVYLEVPNTFRPFHHGKDLEVFFTSVHLFNWGRRSLAVLLARAGLRPVAWDASEPKALRVLTRRQTPRTSSPRPLTAHDIRRLKRYFRLWKAWSVARRHVASAGLARVASALVWRLLRGGLAETERAS